MKGRLYKISSPSFNSISSQNPGISNSTIVGSSSGDDLAADQNSSTYDGRTYVQRVDSDGAAGENLGIQRKKRRLMPASSETQNIKSKPFYLQVSSNLTPSILNYLEVKEVAKLRIAGMH
ncbi:MAG: hypothetical protein ACI9YB_003519 [Halioglobus sp.]